MDDIVGILKGMPDYIGSYGRKKGEIDLAEKTLGTAFAKDYRKYLEEIGLACFDGHELTGLTKTARLDVISVTKEQRIQSDVSTTSWYVVEEANIDGIVIWQSSDGSIYQTQPGRSPIKLCNSLREYIDM